MHLGIMPRGEYQTAVARASIRLWRLKYGERLYVDLVPDAAFWPAERLHQKFHLQRVHSSLVTELASGFRDTDEFLASTAAARLNSAVAGFAEIEAAAKALGYTTDSLRERLQSEPDEDQVAELQLLPERQPNDN